MNTPLLRLCAVLAAGITTPASAATIVWTGGTANWDASNSRWNPADEPDAEDEAVFNTSHTVTMVNATDTILALTLSGGLDLLTNGNDLTVDGLVQLSDAGTVLEIGGSTSLLRADSMTIHTGGTVRLTGGTLTIIEETDSGSLTVNPGGTLSGNGTINLNDGAPAGTILMRLSGGSLLATSNTPGDTSGTDAATLTIDMSDADSRIDLDNNSATVGIARNDSLVINAITHQAADPYSGTLNLGEGATLNMEQPWETDSAVINVNTGGLVAGQPGSPATITGGAMTFTGGTINLDAVDTLRVAARFTATGGTIANAGNLIFDFYTSPEDMVIGAGVDFQMTGANASLTLLNGAWMDIHDADFNPDGSGTATNVITIGERSWLRLHLGAGADTSLGGTIILSGALDVNTGGQEWAISRTVNVPADPSGEAWSPAIWSVDTLNLAGATVTIGDNRRFRLNARSVWAANTSLVTGAGAIAEISGPSIFNGGSYTGTGELVFHWEGATFATATTIDMPAGIVDLDDGDPTENVRSIVNINQDVTINTGVLRSFGSPNGTGPDDALNIAANAELTVNLTDPAAEWTLTADSILSINTLGPTVASTGIAGSDFNLNGTANILGHGVFSARADIAGTVSVSSGSSLNLHGGTPTDLNRLVGGSIVGEGALRALTDTGLAGFGTIATDIEFAGNCVLLADDGTLTVDAPIADVGIIGTAAADGILNVTDPWNTSAAGEVNLLGGELRGELITNAGAGGISGFGLLSAPVTNSSSIGAEGGTLVVQTSGNNNDWDGTGSGQLRGILGNLEIIDNAGVAFTGGVIVNQDHEVFVNGFELEFEPGSALLLGSGTYRSTTTTEFGGNMTVATPVGGDSALRVNGTWTFENGSFTTLNGNLLLDNTLTVIQFGADINGGGALINASGRQLRLLDGVLSSYLLAPVINRGQLQIGLPGTDGQVQGKDYQQTATGALGVDIGGTGLTVFDRFNLTGTASLSGALNLSLTGGFVPAAGQTFTILTAAGGVTGAFTSVTQPPSMTAGLGFCVSYSASTVTLTVVPSYQAWIDQFGLTAPGDKVISANPDGDDLNNLGEFALDGNPANGLNPGKVASKIASIGGVPVLTLTLPVRLGTAPDPADPAGGELGLRQAAESVRYSIQAFSNLTSGPLTVSEVTGPHVLGIHSALPELNPGWQYRTFRTPGPASSSPREFIRAVISE